MKRLLLLLLLLLLPCSARVFAGQKKLAEIQAAYLVNFIKYTHWENRKEEKPLHVYVFAPAVFEALKASSLTSIHGQQIVFSEVKKGNLHFSDADVIFISKDMEKYVKKSVWKSFPDSSLVVSDSGQTVANGGTIQLFIANGKLRFVINISRIRNMTISSNLLRMATDVVK